MEIREIKDINILKSLDLSKIEEIKYSGLIYKKITMVDEADTAFLYYNDLERHLINIKSPDYLMTSYIILQQNSEGVYKTRNT